MHLPAALRAMRHADAGKQHAQVVVDLGDRGDSGAGVLADRFLLDGDGRAETADKVDLGLFHLPDELAGISRERFHIAALTFGVEGVESQGGLAAARHTGQNDQLEARQAHIDVFEVVLLGAADEDFFLKFIFHDRIPGDADFTRKLSQV